MATSDKDVAYVWNTVEEKDWPVMFDAYGSDDEEKVGYDLSELLELGAVRPGYENQYHTFEWYVASLGNCINFCQEKLRKGPDTGCGASLERYNEILSNLENLLEVCVKRGIMKKMHVTMKKSFTLNKFVQR